MATAESLVVVRVTVNVGDLRVGDVVTVDTADAYMRTLLTRKILVPAAS